MIGTTPTPSELLLDIVRLRRAAQSHPDVMAMLEIRDVERVLFRQLGGGVPKRECARALGVSVQALESYVRAGFLPSVVRQGSTRRLVDAESAVKLLMEVQRLRSAGETRGLLARAIKALRWKAREQPLVLRAEVAVLPRPNVSSAELRRDFLASTPSQRLADGASLSRFATELAIVGARSRAEALHE